MNYFQNHDFPLSKRGSQFFRIMKLTGFILVITMLNVGATVYSQATKLNAQMTNVTVKDVFKSIESQSEFRFFYSDDLTFVNQKVNVNATNKTVESILDEVLADSNLTYKMLDNNLIVIVPGSVMQGVTIKGEIFDMNNQPMPGVNIRVKGTTTGVVTDVSGSYTITVPSTSSVLQVSFIGYKSQEITVGEQRTINVTMEEDNLEIEEVTVVAYGTQRKRDLTGSISVVDSKTLSAQSNSTVTRALEGSVPGLQVAAIDGQPGLDMGVRIRGIGTASQNNANALIVIDGVPAVHDNVLATLNPKDIESVTVLKDAASASMYGSRGANGVLLITTKKGAKGKARVNYDGRFGINQIGPYKYDKVSEPQDVYEWAWKSIYNSAMYAPGGAGDNSTTRVGNPRMSSAQAAEFASQHLFNFAGFDASDQPILQANGLGNWMLYDVPGAVYTPTGSATTASSTMSGAYLVGTDGKLNPQAKLLYWDPIEDHVLENRFRQEHNISVSGASDKTDYFISAGYLSDPSYIKGSEFERYNARVNVNVQIYDWLKAGLNSAYANRMTRSMATRYGRNPGSAWQNVFRWINGTNQLIPMYARNLDGSYRLNENGQKMFPSTFGLSASPVGPTTPMSATTDLNLIYMMENDMDKRVSHDVNLRGYVEAKFLQDFTFIATMSTDNYFETRYRYFNPITGQYINEKGGYGETPQTVNVLNAQQLLRYNKTIDKHEIEALAGHEFYQWKYENQLLSAGYMFLPDFPTWANAPGRNQIDQIGTSNGSKEKEAMESYFGRVNYVYASKYYAQASIRGDGSSKFKKPENRWGVFWSVGAGWRISAEDFMASTQNWLTDLKLRASYGVTGNQNGVDRYSGYQRWNLGASGYNPNDGNRITPTGFALTQATFVNDALTWEKIDVVDAGIDFRFWNRFYGSIDYYNRVTKNMIWAENLPYSLGQATLTKNTAKLQNYGIEWNVGVDIVKNKDLYWSVTLNGTHYRTKIKEVPAGTGSEALGGNWTAGVDAWTQQGLGGTGSIAYLRGINKDMYNMYIFKYAGPDPTYGLPLFWHKVTQSDLDAGRYTGSKVGDNVKAYSKYTTSNDRYEMGSATPDIIGGFSTSVSWKGIDFMAQFAFQIGGLYMGKEFSDNLYKQEKIGAPVSFDMVNNTWTPENPNAFFPIQMASSGVGQLNGVDRGNWEYSDAALWNASYFSVKNITLGYTLPQKWMDSVGIIESARVYFSADNIWMKSAHKGLDPRMSLIGGFDIGQYIYPYSRTISLGININF